jgi:hypothetical protein
MLPQGSVTPLQKFSKISPEDEKILELQYKYERLQLDFEVTEKEAAEARAEVRHLKQKLMEQEESYKGTLNQLRRNLFVGRPNRAIETRTRTCYQKQS